MDTVYVVTKDTFTSKDHKYLKESKVVYVAKTAEQADKWATVAQDNSWTFSPNAEVEFYIQEVLLH